MKSMTGYGFAERTTDECHLSVELKSYNNRFLEINHAIPYFLSAFEQEIDQSIKTIAKRGHIDVNVRVKQLQNRIELLVDQQAVESYATAFRQIARYAHIQTEPSLSDFVSAEGILLNVREQDGSVYSVPLFDALQEALHQLDVAKMREGEVTLADLVRLGDELSKNLLIVKRYAGELEIRLKDTLLTRFEELLGQRGYDENRFLQEVAVMLNRYSINEEIVRLGAHIDEYGLLLGKSEPIGKRLDFLCQEMNREINTIGSKSTMVEINHSVVVMKDCLENIREQVRNIE